MSVESVAQIRPAGRVLLIDTRNRILLIRSEDPNIDQPMLWLTPGGGCEPGETPSQSAIRELWEETGIRATELGPCVWHRRHVWRFGDRMIDSREDFFLLRFNEELQVAPAQLSKFEISIVCEHRWWRHEELGQASEEFFVPRQIAQLLAPLLQGDIPAEPLNIGA